ncbi:hypothetical protein G7Y89_g6484 [Cudoniella acicularis]|uniref:Uncharacterized protein n=1 Tax=Cudoniella acicularis TaxID=354080 RepID=A0A8H4RMV9_9HELO|nr:hypothetical protein G7Y89_g6484 [Cudoniella acicularis]
MDWASDGLGHIQWSPNGVEEDLRARDAQDPISGNSAIEETAREGHGAHTMRNGVYFLRATVLRLRTDILKTGFDIKTGIIRRPVFLCDHQLADSVDGDENAVSCACEVVHCIYLDGGDGENLFVDRGAGDHEEVFGGDGWVAGFPDV